MIQASCKKAKRFCNIGGTKITCSNPKRAMIGIIRRKMYHSKILKRKCPLLINKSSVKPFTKRITTPSIKRPLKSRHLLSYMKRCSPKNADNFCVYQRTQSLHDQITQHYSLTLHTRDPRYRELSYEGLSKDQF